MIFEEIEESDAALVWSLFSRLHKIQLPDSESGPASGILDSIISQIKNALDDTASSVEVALAMLRDKFRNSSGAGLEPPMESEAFSTAPVPPMRRRYSYPREQPSTLQ